VFRVVVFADGSTSDEVIKTMAADAAVAIHRERHWHHIEAVAIKSGMHDILNGATAIDSADAAVAIGIKNADALVAAHFTRLIVAKKFNNNMRDLKSPPIFVDMDSLVIMSSMRISIDPGFGWTKWIDVVSRVVCVVDVSARTCTFRNWIYTDVNRFRTNGDDNIGSVRLVAGFGTGKKEEEDFRARALLDSVTYSNLVFDDHRGMPTAEAFAAAFVRHNLIPSSPSRPSLETNEVQKTKTQIYTEYENWIAGRALEMLISFAFLAMTVARGLQKLALSCWRAMIFVYRGGEVDTTALITAIAVATLFVAITMILACGFCYGTTTDSDAVSRDKRFQTNDRKRGPTRQSRNRRGTTENKSAETFNQNERKW